MSKGVLKVASILSRKDGDGTYIKTNVKLVATLRDGSEIVLPENTLMNIEDPRALPDQLFERGVISEERASQMREYANKLPDFVKAELNVSLNRLSNNENTNRR